MKEQEIERLLTKKLSDLKYTYRPDIRDRAALEGNFRTHFEALNRVNLSGSEFTRLLEQIVTPDVFAAAQTLRERSTLLRDDDTPLHFTLLNIKDWCKNTFEVVNQLRMNTHSSHHRYDVLLLMNGVPVVQIELKSLDISPRRAMQQIVDYKNDAGNGYGRTLLCFMQLFIVSNRSDTWYFANNNTRHFTFDADERHLPIYRHAAEDNQKITHLDDFAGKFLAKCTLGEMLSRYMVLVRSEQKLLMMRPYQIYAVQNIVDCIGQGSGNGYIWHTTGSGKTLTSFKASTLLRDNPAVDKCLFVVDRKDLDRQTREEFNRFQEGCVEENTNTNSLVRRLLSTDHADKVIVTTIQKLGLALDGGSGSDYRQRLEPLQGKRMVIIFDECHRSQFGDNHRAIRDFFPHSQLFGFTGTPIFPDNSRYVQIDGKDASYVTTQDIFEKQLHAYTITHAIEDGNVLRFHIDYFKGEGERTATGTLAKRAVVGAILDKHDAATAGRKFNAILATASIPDATEYFGLFGTMQAERQAHAQEKADGSEYRPLNIACVFSPPAYGNRDVQQIQEDLPQEYADNQQQPDDKKNALARIIAAYNVQYGTNHSVGEFDLYYQDVQKRIKDQQYPNRDLPHAQKIDVVIVVDMLLTGFDSKYLNTLYVDKNLKYHGLIQALSRTNRVLNDTKPYGNILDFRGQQAAVDDAIKLFSGEGREKAREMWLVDPAPVVIGQLEEAVTNLTYFMRSQKLKCTPDEVQNLKGDAARSIFINHFKDVQRLTTQLSQYTDLTDEDRATIAAILPPDELQAFRGVYLDTAQRLKDRQDRAKDPPPEVQALDFEFVLFASALIDYDYIMKLMADFSAQTPGKETVTREEMAGAIASDAKFMGQKKDLLAYMDTLKAGEGLSQTEVMAGYDAFRTQKDATELHALAGAHGLTPASLQAFVDTTLQRLIFDGEHLSELLAPLNLGWKARAAREQALMTDLIPILKKRAAGRDISGLKAYED
ncbi:type I restriction endonuclease subunit R [Deinococcus frigens]|uniref:type I restriction endonuclease subunit R n=1 Tax=Deinococcus frigens TaxID=249403 RepID=UPI0004958ABF|nr:type I restriction endonuclease subunit R [Deinococcus frigens]